MASLQSLAGKRVSLSVHPFHLVLHSHLAEGHVLLLLPVCLGTGVAGPEQELRIGRFTWEEIKIKLYVVTMAT